MTGRRHLHEHIEALFPLELFDAFLNFLDQSIVGTHMTSPRAEMTE
jgi:hypothetical protein